MEDRKLNGLRVGLIGSGFIANRKHLPAWKKLGSRARVVALCDPNVRQAEAIAQAYGISKVYSDFDQMFRAEHLDAVDICTPPRTHATLATRSLEGGAHALIEKPMAIDTEECDQIIAVAKQTGRKVCVAHSDLFYPSFVKARTLVNDGAIGEFRGMRIFLSTPVDYITSKSDHWAHRLAGGVLGETGPHVVYMTLAFINPILEVRVQARKQLSHFPWSPFEDYRLELIGDTASCSAALTYSTNRWAAELDLWGSDGHIKIDLETQTLAFHGRSDLKPTTLAMSTVREVSQMLLSTSFTGLKYATRQFENTHESLVREFVKSIQDGGTPPVTPEEGREAVRVMDLVVNQLKSRLS